MTTFTQIFNEFVVAPLTQTAVKAILPAEATLEQCVFHYFVVKYSIEYDIREMARLTAKFLSEFREMGIHENTKVILRESDLRHNKRYGIGYPHADGTYHFFAIEEEVELSPEVEAILEVFKNFDWTYSMSDDHRVWSAGERAYKALVKQCKDAGLTEKEALALQEKYWLNRGYTKPFYCMAHIRY